MYPILDNYNYRIMVERCDDEPDGSGKVLSGWSMDLVRRKALPVRCADERSCALTVQARTDVARQFEFSDADGLGFELHVPANRRHVTLVCGQAAGDVLLDVDVAAISEHFRRQRKIDAERKVVRVARQLLTVEGWRKVTRKIDERLHPPVDYYDQWIAEHETETKEDAEREIAGFVLKPRVSIVVPVYNVEECWLRRFVESVQEQWYTNWELCIADDHSSAGHVRPVLESLAAADTRIKVVFRTENGRISKATNSAIELATGALVGFMDNDDELAPQALYAVVRELNLHPETDFFYTDEDKISEGGKRSEPFFKPDWSPHLLLGHNYITHFTVVSKALLDEVGPLRPEFDGSQDYDFVLRATERAHRVAHIPQMLYHWRTIATSVAGNPRSKMYAYEAGRKAVESAYMRRGIAAKVTMLDNLGTYKSDYRIEGRPRTVIVMSGFTRDRADQVKRLLRHEACDFVNASTTDVIAYLKDSDAEYVAFLDAVHPDDASWLREAMNQLADSTVGVVGGKVMRNHTRIVNIGVPLRALRDGRPFEGQCEMESGIGYYFRPVLPRDIFAVTEQCMITRRRDFLDLNGFDNHLAKGLRGIDYCRRLYERNRRTTMFDPYMQCEDMRNEYPNIAQSAINTYCAAHPGMEDPFASAYYPPSRSVGDKPGIVYSIDVISRTAAADTAADALSVSGWVADLQSDDEVRLELKVDSRPVDVDITRSVRFDVSRTLMLPERTMVGFDISRSVPTGAKVELVMKGSSETRTIVLDDTVRTASSSKGAAIVRQAVRGITHPRAALRSVRDRYVTPCRENRAYQTFIRNHEQYDSEQVRADIKGFSTSPLFSILVPVYNVAPQWLDRCIESVRQQYYGNWELCLADDHSSDSRVRPLLERYSALDPRIKTVFREKNGHISRATNSALSIATGDYVVLMDNDDELPPFALYEVAKLIDRRPDVDLIYSDEDKIDAKGRRSDPTFKPDWSPDLLMSTNYISHLGVYRKSIVDAIGGFRVGYEGAQDYDLVLRFTEHTDKMRIAHIAKVLYHWRMLESSTASDPHSKSYAFTAGRKALESTLERRGLTGRVVTSELNGLYDVEYDVAEPELVSIIIPTKNGYDNIERCVTSILKKTTYPNYEIIIADNGSTNPRMFGLYQRLEQESDHPIRVLSIDVPFNFSRINNIAAKEANGKYLLFLNDDTKVREAGWMTSMVSLAQFDRIGMVGAKLSYPNNRIQHAGVVLGLGGVAGHVFVGTPDTHIGRYGRLMENVNYYAVTAACCMVKAEDFHAVKGFDETFEVAYNDVDLCIRIHDQLGKDNVWAHQAELYHFESVTRGYDDKDKKKTERLEREAEHMRRQYGSIIENDPYYNPNLALQGSDMRLRI